MLWQKQQLDHQMVQVQLGTSLEKDAEIILQHQKANSIYDMRNDGINLSFFMS